MSFLIGRSRPGSYTRVCDVCARLRPPPWRVIDGLHICDMHEDYVPRAMLDKLPYREIIPKPIPNAKPYQPRDTHEAAEAEVLRLMEYAPADTLVATVSAPLPGANSVQSAAWAGIYLHALIVEDKRPPHWISRAESLLRELADWLYTSQYAGPGAATVRTDDDLRWGSYNRGTVLAESLYVEDSAAAGIALLRAYQIFGASKYLDAARACAWFVRTCQCGDKVTNHPSSTDAAGSFTFHWGMWTHRIALTSAYDFDHRYYPSDLIGLEFLALYESIVGDETIGSSGTNAVVSASRAAAVSTCIAEARAFWTTEIPSIDDGGTIAGFSTATPREFFDSYPSSKGPFTGRGSWQYQDGPLSSGTLITSASWAMGIRAFHALDGATDAVTAKFDWLMTFTDGGTYALPTNYDDRVLWGDTLGDFDPKVALTTLLGVVGGNLNGSGLYDLTTVGLLAPLWATRQPAAFKALKSKLNDPQPRSREGTDRDGEQAMYLAPLGRCGLSYQPYTSAALAREQSVPRAAQVGLVYRQAPKAFMGRLD